MLSVAALAHVGAIDAAAQTRRSSDAVRAMGRAAEQHPLDDATVRKVVAIMRAWQPPPPPPPKGEDAKGIVEVMEYNIWHSFPVVIQRELADQNSTATIDRTAPLKAAIVAQGLSSADFVRALLAYKAARVADDLMPMVPHEPTAVVKQNIAVIRRVGPKETLPSWW